MQTTLALSALILSPLNVRSQEPTAEEIGEMACSILAQGLIEPLVVHRIGKKNIYGVLCGSRRWRAITLLQLDKTNGDEGVTFDFENIPVTVRTGTDEELIEISLSENVHRKDLLPHEEFTAYANAAKGGATAAAIAIRFGKPKRYIEQRLRLGNLSPIVFDALVTGKIGIDGAQAYAATDDQAVQERVFKKLSRGHGHYSHQIRSEIRGASHEHAVQQKLLLVGKDAYLEAGGKLTEDLFDSGYIIGDLKLLDKLFSAAYDARLAILVERCGGNVRAVTDWRECGNQIEPIYGPFADEEDTAEYELLEAETLHLTDAIQKMNENEQASDEDYDRATARQAEVTRRLQALDAGRPISFPDGLDVVFVPSVRDGYITARGFHEARALEQEEGAAATVTPDPVTAPLVTGPKITKKADEQLGLARRQILVNALDDADPKLHGFGFMLLLFSLARGRYGDGTPNEIGSMTPGAGPSPAFVGHNWFIEPDESEAFALFISQDGAELEAVAAKLLARMIVPHRETGPGIIQHMAQTALDNKTIRGRTYWEPTEDFFNLFSKAVVCSMIEEVDKDQAAKAAKLKSGEAVTRAVAFFTGRIDGLGEELRSRALEWVPAWLMFHVEQSDDFEPETYAEIRGPAADETHEEVAKREPPRPVEGDPVEAIEAYEQWQRDMERTFPTPANDTGSERAAG